MAEPRNNPYGVFNFMVEIDNINSSVAVGGFSDVSGLGREVSYSDYRNGNDNINTARKIPNTYKSDDVTLKRGLVGTTELFEWIKMVADGERSPRSVIITLMDEARRPVAKWKLTNAQPKKWTGPTLAAKGGGEVAMEELQLVHEGIVYF